MKKTVGVTVAVVLAFLALGWYLSVHLGGQNGVEASKVFAEACALVVLYFVPAAIAADKEKHNAGAIYALNLFLGWTLIGWVVSLVWALTKDAPAPSVQVNVQAVRACMGCGAPVPGKFCTECGRGPAVAQ